MDFGDVWRRQRRALESDEFRALAGVAVERLRQTHPHVDLAREPHWSPVGWDLDEMNRGKPYTLCGFEAMFPDGDDSQARHVIVRIVPQSGVILILELASRYHEGWQP